MREFRSSGHLWTDGEVPSCHFCGKDFDNVGTLYETPYDELCCDNTECTDELMTWVLQEPVQVHIKIEDDGE